MSGFISQLAVRELSADSGRLWELAEPLTYIIDPERSITVPAGFVTDGASVPRALWAVYPAWGRYSRAAVMHDHLCALVHDGRPHPYAPTRADADAMFRKAMGDDGVSSLTRTVLYAAVRVGAHMRGAAVNQPFDTEDQP